MNGGLLVSRIQVTHVVMAYLVVNKEEVSQIDDKSRHYRSSWSQILKVRHFLLCVLKAAAVQSTIITLLKGSYKVSV